MCSTYQDVRSHISQGNLNKAIDCALQLARQKSDSESLVELNLLSSRYQKNERENRLGIVAASEYNSEHAKLALSLLTHVGKIEEKEKNPTKDNNLIDRRGSGNISIQGVQNSQINIGGDQQKAKQKILFLAANPTDQASLQTDKEYRIISERMRRNEYYELLHPQFALTIENLLIAMNQKPQIVHFAGHGEQQGIIITNAQNQHKLMPTRALRRLFRQHKEGIQLILLNSCYSEAQAKVLSELGMYVIGMNNAAEDNAALDFAAGLYIGLSEGKDVERAYDDAMIMIETNHPDFADLPVVWKSGQQLDI